MRRTMIPALLLISVALSNGVVLERLQPFEVNPKPNGFEGESSANSYSPLTDCEVMKKLFCRKLNWMSENNQLKTWKMIGAGTDNNQEGDNYNEYFNKGQGVSDDGSLKDPWLSYPRQFDRLEKGFGSRYADMQKGNDKWEKLENFDFYNKDPLPNIRMLYLRNKDIAIEKNKAYYVYDIYIATTNPFDFLKLSLYCQFKYPASRPLLYDSPPTEVGIDKQEERERFDTNDLNPLVKEVTEKRDGDSETGQKEIPDNLVFNEEEKSEVQKKLFSFWSRLQSLSQKGRQLPTRRHTFVYYGPDGVRDGPLSAETRASHLRPPGQPLRWG